MTRFYSIPEAANTGQPCYLDVPPQKRTVAYPLHSPDLDRCTAGRANAPHGDERQEGLYERRRSQQNSIYRLG